MRARSQVKYGLIFLVLTSTRDFGRKRTSYWTDNFEIASAADDYLVPQKGQWLLSCSWCHSLLGVSALSSLACTVSRCAKMRFLVTRAPLIKAARNVWSHRHEQPERNNQQMKIQSPLCGMVCSPTVTAFLKVIKNVPQLQINWSLSGTASARIKTNTIFEQNLSFSSFSSPLLSAAFHRRITRSLIKSWQSVTNGSALLIETPQSFLISGCCINESEI